VRTADTVDAGGHLPTALLPQTSINEVDRCVKESTGWSSCSASCGVGVSVRVSNENEDCVTMHQRRLCVIRPCGVDDSDLVRHKFSHLSTDTFLLLLLKSYLIALNLVMFLPLRDTRFNQYQSINLDF